MKQSIILILAVFATVFVSCKKDDDDPDTKNNTENNQQLPTGTYKLLIDNNLIAEGSTQEVGMIQDDEGNYTANASLAQGDEISILATGFSMQDGEVKEMSNGGSQVIITGKNILLSDGSEEMYFAISGDLTRESGNKISFEGTCADMLNTTSYPFSGYIESEAFKNIR